MGYQPYIDSWISNGYKQIIIKTAHIRFPLRKITHHYKMNDNINMDSTILGSMYAACGYLSLGKKVEYVG